MRAHLAVAFLLSSCTFPDVEIAGQGGGDTSTSTTSGTGGPTSATTGVMSTTGTATVECDDDLDGALIEHPACCTVAAECDCNDDNKDVYPGQTEWFTLKRPDKLDGAADAFDYDCSGANEEQWPEGDCTTLGACVTPSTLQVFQPVGAYECGAPGRHRYCNGVTCEQPQVMLGCR